MGDSHIYSFAPNIGINNGQPCPTQGQGVTPKVVFGMKIPKVCSVLLGIYGNSNIFQDTFKFNNGLVSQFYNYGSLS